MSDRSADDSPNLCDAALSAETASPDRNLSGTGRPIEDENDCRGRSRSIADNEEIDLRSTGGSAYPEPDAVTIKSEPFDNINDIDPAAKHEFVARMNLRDRQAPENIALGVDRSRSSGPEESFSNEEGDFSTPDRKATDEHIINFYHRSINLPGPFAVSLVDRNRDPSLTVVYHCWLCDAEFLDKLGIVQHLKEWHMDVPVVADIEKKMRVPICLMCGVSGGCEHRSINEDEDDDESSAREKPSEVGSEDMLNGKFSCSVCNISFQSSYEQREHFSKEHPNQRMYKCSYCPDAFYQHHKLVVHTRTHTGYKPYACGICGSKFPKNSDLNRHIRTHSSKGEKPYQCAQCGQTFTQKCSLEKHARRHADKDGGYPCYHCGLTFAFEGDLDAHSKKEHGERTWKCMECGKLFEERRHLIVHAKTHQEGIKYQCTYCDRTFSKRHQLAKHEDRIHHRQDDLKCKICQKEFRRRENLTRHMNIHLDRREFQCTQCGMAFTEKGSLKRHVLSRHEQHRPFKCRVCGKAFSRRFLLRKHHLRAHKLFPFEGEENPMPTRGFGAKSVNIDSYIRRTSDAGTSGAEGGATGQDGDGQGVDEGTREADGTMGSRLGLEEDDQEEEEEMPSEEMGFGEDEDDDVDEEEMTSSPEGIAREQEEELYSNTGKC